MRMLRLSALIVGILMNAVFAVHTSADAPYNNHSVTTKPGISLAEDSSTAKTETIVFLRHGEKAVGGLGQLSPQGFNRALALIGVLPEKYGKPDFLFAPNPAATQMREGEGKYDYVRALTYARPLAL